MERENYWEEEDLLDGELETIFENLMQDSKEMSPEEDEEI